MYTNIVVGTDGSSQALDAVDRAGQLAQRLGIPSVHVVSAVVPHASFTLRSVNDELEQANAATGPGSEAERHVAAAEATLASYEVATTPHVEIGEASSVILDVAEEVDADLVVVGARGLSALQRFVRGSVSTRIAQHSPCDVLVVEHDD